MNVSGQEVATGIADPLNMFVVFGIVLILAFIGWAIWQIWGR